MKTIEEEFPEESQLGAFDAPAIYAALRARAAEMERALQWRLIAEAPRDGAHILCHAPDDWTRLHGAESIVELWWDNDLLGWHNQRMGLMRPTHFRPLPPAPEIHQTNK